MAEHSAIEWTDATWNPVRGCTKVSEGCRHCYAETFAERWRGIKGHPYEQGFDLRLVPEKLDQPLRWTQPRMIFVNSMSDLFHKDVPDWYIMQVWRTMAECPQHTFQILTKRAERVPAWVAKWADVEDLDARPIMARGPAAVRAAHTSGRALMFAELLDSMGEPPPGCAFPTYDWMEGPRWESSVLPNVWLGVSVENQQTADERIPHLLRTPAAVRFLSVEPLLSAVDLRFWDPRNPKSEGEWMASIEEVGVIGKNRPVDWVIVGGESGPGARPMEADWARSLRDQCVEAGVPFFFKQWGGVHKKQTGRLLDGRTWDQMPRPAGVGR